MSAVVLYTLKMAGDLSGKLPALSSELSKLKDRAQAATTSVLAMGTAARTNFNSAGEEGKKASEGAFKAAAGFAAAGFAVHTLLKNQEDYREATARLVTVAKDLGKTLADAIGPKVASFIDSFTVGLTYIGTLVTGVVGPAFRALGDIVSALGERMSETVRSWKLMAQGDFAGAAEILKGHLDAWKEVAEIGKKAFADIGEAQQNAFDAAFATWKKQVDGISDQVGEIRKAYADIVSGAMVGAGGVNIGGVKIPMGAQSKENIGIQGHDTGLGTLEEATLSQTQQLELISGTTSAMETGIGGILGMIPVFGGFLEGIWSFVSNFGAISMNIVDELISFITDIGDQFATIIFDVPMRIVEALPDMVASIIALIPRIIAELIASGPKLLLGLVKAIMAIPGAFAKAFAEVFAQMWLDIVEAFKELGKIFSGKEGKVFGTSFFGKENKGNRSFLGIGGEKGGAGGGFLGFGGKGNRSDASSSRSAGGGSSSIAIQFHGIQDVDRQIREIRKRLGPLGTNQRLDPFTGG